jgi:hypothetical protein
MKRPRLGPKELPLWADFLATTGLLFTDYEYDFRVIPVAGRITTAKGPYQYDWDNLTCPRIDAMARSGRGKLTLFEVRPDADADPVLRLIGYRELLLTLRIFTEPMDLAVVCRSMTPVTKNLCDAYGITVYQISSTVSDLSLVNQGVL